MVDEVSQGMKTSIDIDEVFEKLIAELLSSEQLLKVLDVLVFVEEVLRNGNVLH